MKLNILVISCVLVINVLHYYFVMLYHIVVTWARLQEWFAWYIHLKSKGRIMYHLVIGYKPMYVTNTISKALNPQAQLYHTHYGINTILKWCIVEWSYLRTVSRYLPKMEAEFSKQWNLRMWITEILKGWLAYPKYHTFQQCTRMYNLQHQSL